VVRLKITNFFTKCQGTISKAAPFKNLKPLSKNNGVAPVILPFEKVWVIFINLLQNEIYFSIVNCACRGIK